MYKFSAKRKPFFNRIYVFWGPLKVFGISIGSIGSTLRGYLENDMLFRFNQRADRVQPAGYIHNIAGNEIRLIQA